MVFMPVLGTLLLFGSGLLSAALFLLLADYLPLAEFASHGDSLGAMAQLGNARRERVNEAAQSAVPRLMWAALILGALITIGFAFLFNLGSREVHAVLVFLLTLIIGCLLLLVHELNYPFSGPAG